MKMILTNRAQPIDLIKDTTTIAWIKGHTKVRPADRIRQPVNSGDEKVSTLLINVQNSLFRTKNVVILNFDMFLMIITNSP